jgi:iron complex transport system ATP-binding protein
MAELHAVSYRAGGKQILDAVTLNFRANRCNVLLGPNGAGKTTLLRIAAGLLRPSAGTVTWAGAAIAGTGLEALARRRGFLSQHVELPFALEAAAVVRMGRYPHHGEAPARRDAEIVRDALALVGLSDKAAQNYATLSAGEQQKVQMARVLAQIWDAGGGGAGRYLFLDEPTTNLDIHHQLQLLEITRGLLRGGCTVVAILHDLNLALQYGDCFFVLQGGRVVREADDSGGISRELIEDVFGVSAHAVADAESGRRVWVFGAAAG